MTSAGVESVTARHELGLFTVAEHPAAFEGAGLTVPHDPVGLAARGSRGGLYIGVRSTP